MSALQDDITTIQTEYDALSDLLDEYAEKLGAMIEVYTRVQNRLITIAVGSLLLFVLSVAWARTGVGPVSLRMELLIVVALTCIVVLAVPLYTILGQIRSLRWDIRVATIKVDKVAKIASQRYEQREVDLARRLRLELRLTDADAVLRHARGILGIVLTSPYTRANATVSEIPPPRSNSSDDVGGGSAPTPVRGSAGSRQPAGQ